MYSKKIQPYSSSLTIPAAISRKPKQIEDEKDEITGFCVQNIRLYGVHTYVLYTVSVGSSYLYIYVYTTIVDLKDYLSGLTHIFSCVRTYPLLVCQSTLSVRPSVLQEACIFSIDRRSCCLELQLEQQQQQL